MITLGLAGGLDFVHEQKLDTPENYTYDGAAVLVEDGEVVAAIEEERLDRIKHSNKFPIKAIHHCLEYKGLNIQEIDRIAYYVDERLADTLLGRLYLNDPKMSHRLTARFLLKYTLSQAFGCDLDVSKFSFYDHKLTHAASAMHHSGFDESLVFVIDNAGGTYRGSRSENGRVLLEKIAETSPAQSIQKLCHSVLPLLGFGIFEEYKALALGSYGDAGNYSSLLTKMYELLPGGEYKLNLGNIALLMKEIEPRRAFSPLSQAYMDLAAALQEAMEKIILHVLDHYRTKTGLRNLCMAGGMAENVQTNGSVLYSGLFEKYFVHPAAYDSGCAIGAALLASQESGQTVKKGQIKNVYWGTDIGSQTAIKSELDLWSDSLQPEFHADIARKTAELLSKGKIVGWIQGRSEFGSHPLGNRNVFADPRFEENREQIHKSLNRPEAFRPLAAVLLEEDLNEWCELPAAVHSLPFLSFAVRIRAEKQRFLAGAMQADGFARIQTVSRESNPRLWNLVKAFGELTGTAALLSTSFNSSREPAAETIEDAVTTFLSTGLDYLIAGDFVTEKMANDLESFASLEISLPPYVRIIRSKGLFERQKSSFRDEIRTTFSPEISRSISPALADFLIDLNQDVPLGNLIDENGTAENKKDLINELTELWAHRLIKLQPARRTRIHDER